MITAVASSLMYSKKRRTVMEVFSPRLRKLWKEWDLRVLVLLSLTLQVVLIILGNRRKYNHKFWIRVVVWCAYLASDYVATCALGVLSNNLGDIYEEGGSLDPDIELTSLWAPFLLLHLGGPDTITAYALEDNELWLRHSLGLFLQTAITVYIFLMAWTGSLLSIQFILMFIAGLVKYGERTWVLRSVSLIKSVGTGKTGEYSDYGDYSSARKTEFDIEMGIRVEEGFVVEFESYTESRQQVDFSILDNGPISDEDQLLTAYNLLNLTKCFFLDVILSPRDNIKAFFGNLCFENAFKVIELELGMLYDFLYTKLSVICSPWGLGLRLVTFLLSCFVLVFFSFHDHKLKYSKVDLSVTFLLPIVAIILEIYSAFTLLSSDRFFIWSIMHKNVSTFHGFSSWIKPIFKSPRWSNNMAQYSFVSSCMNVKPYHYVLKPLTILDQNVEKRWHITHEEVPEKLKDLIFSCLRSQGWGNHQYPYLSEQSDQDFGVGNFEEELGKSSLFWHIVTEMLYNLADDDQQRRNSDDIFAQSSLKISRYMLYLLLFHPDMLSVGINQISLQNEVLNQVEKFFSKEGLSGGSERDACDGLVKWSEQQDKNNLVYKAVSFMKLNKDLTWEEICEVWLAILAYAAKKSKGNPHAKGLRNGGELLTHVWLLAAHLGLTHHSPSDNRVTRLYKN